MYSTYGNNLVDYFKLYETQYKVQFLAPSRTDLLGLTYKIWLTADDLKQYDYSSSQVGGKG